MATELRALDDAADPPLLTREILEDRWSGLMETGNRFGDGGRDLSKLHESLIKVLDKIMEGLIRGNVHEDTPNDAGGFLVEEAIDFVHRRWIEGLAELGMAR
jgi:hypothetical protein